MPKDSQKVFRSFDDLRRHYFPKQWEKEQAGKVQAQEGINESPGDKPTKVKKLNEKEMEEMGG